MWRELRIMSLKGQWPKGKKDIFKYLCRKKIIIKADYRERKKKERALRKKNNTCKAIIRKERIKVDNQKLEKR